MKYLSLFLFPLALAVFSFPEPSQAEDAAKENVIIVLDASGSMWGQIEGEAKIAIAKSVVKGILSDWDPSLNLGLSVYGHRRKADCKDIELLLSPAPLNTERFSAAVDKLSPKGKTPLTDAVIQAAEELKYTEERATVVLISDGIETCEKDPCAVSKSLAEQGLDFTAHVIGFDVNAEEEIAQLRCVAENTGGAFMSAKNAKTLKESLTAAVVAVKNENARLNLSARAQAGEAPLKEVRWKVFATDEAGKRKPVPFKYGGGPTPSYRVKPGAYFVQASSVEGNAKIEKAVSVKEGESLDVEVLLPQEGILKLKAVTEAGGAAVSNVAWYIMQEVSGRRTMVTYGGGDTPEYQLLSGSYIAMVKRKKGVKQTKQVVEVVAGQTRSFEILIEP